MYYTYKGALAKLSLARLLQVPASCQAGGCELRPLHVSNDKLRSLQPANLTTSMLLKQAAAIRSPSDVLHLTRSLNM